MRFPLLGRWSAPDDAHRAARPSLRILKSRARIMNGGLADAARRFDTPAARQARERLHAGLERRPLFDWAMFDDACRIAQSRMADLPLGEQQDYLDFHRRRFFQLDNLVGALAQGRSPLSILDVGLSINTLVLGRLLPAATLSALDRAEVWDAPTRALEMFDVDLTDPDLDRQALPRRFDVIVFAEVLEHLLANPVRVLSFLIRGLAPSGFLVVTTPNFFSGANVWRMERLINPQPVLPASVRRGEEVQHHVREYSMSELLLMSEEAGGRPLTYFFSAPWEPTPPESPELGANLTVVVQPAPLTAG
jgi:SAM-dependent methyltransferase